ncbi:MAG: hypothetical protein ACEQSB_05565 [Undibacterium sp.]
MALFDRAKKAFTYLAENSGVISLNTQKKILGAANPMFALKAIPEETFDTKNGENSREIITYITQPPRVQYMPILGTGNETSSVPHPTTGVATNIAGDKVGRGCSLPADTLGFGYDVRTSCPKARAIEVGPFCILDLIQKNAFRQVIDRLWSEMPTVLKMQFNRQLLREVIALGKFNFSAADGGGTLPYTTDSGTFPCAPQGGPSIGMLRNLKNVIMPWGWADGAPSPMVDGSTSFQMHMGCDSYEWAIESRKNAKGMTINTTRTADDKTFGKTTVYEGIQFIDAERPMRGVYVQTGVNTSQFIEIEPTTIVPAEGEGWKEIPNADYEKSWIVIDGQKLRVLEIGFFIHPKALVRESMGAMPTMPGGKTFNRKFDFTVNPIPDYELASKGCNKDMFFFGYRALHAFAMKRRMHELAGAFAYIAPKPRFDVIDPWTSNGVAPTNVMSVQDLPSQGVSGCEPCARPEALDNEPVQPTCAELFPTNGVGLIKFRQSRYDVEENAGNLTLVVERYGGDSGAASCVMTITEGTATEPQNFTAPSGFAGTGPFTKTISWLDGEDGPKTVIVPIVAAAGDDSGKQFTAALGTYSGSAAGSLTATTVVLLDDDKA